MFLAIGAVVGAFVRYKLTESSFLFTSISLNVLIVNVLGSFILGLFIILSTQWHIDGRYSLLVAVGFCGSLTTMSSFALNSVNLLEHSNYIFLALNIIANVGLSIGALLGGKTLMSYIIDALNS